MGSDNKPIWFSDAEKLKELKPFQTIGAKKDHKLDRIVFSADINIQQIMPRCSEYIDRTNESFTESPSISCFSAVTGNGLIYDFHPIEYFEAATGVNSGYDCGFMFQAFDPKDPNYCGCAGLFGHVGVNERFKLSSSIIFVDDVFAHFVSKDNIDAITDHAIAVYFATQYIVRNRPVELREKTECISSSRHQKDSKKRRKRVVRLVKTIYIDCDTVEAVEKQSHEIRTIQCPCWGVIGHWRTYKSGKKVWIEPYKKGRERKNPSAYKPKDYAMEVSL